jgi:hypothetical protein
VSALTRSSARPAMRRPSLTRPTTTPALLASWSVGMVVLIVAFGAVAALAVSTRGSAADSARATSEPLLVDAQSVYTSLSDADSTAAGAFLAGASAPQALRDRYRADLAAAAGSLARAAQQAGLSSQLGRSLQTLSVDLPIYSGLVETARANNLQGFPVGAAYLGEASNLMRTALLPAAGDLYQTERQRLREDQSGATSVVALAAAGVLIILVLAVGIGLQRWLRRRFNRSFSPPLLVALVITFGLLAWLAVALAAQTRNVHRSDDQGASPITTLTQARILALQARADDELTLVTRDSVPSYQADYARVSRQLTELLAAPPARGSDRAVLNEAAAAFARMQSVHEAIRRDDENGNLTAAIAAASGPSSGALPATATRLDRVLNGGISDAQGRFDSASKAAGSAVNGLLVGVIILSLLIAGLVLLAARPRLAEYR